MSESVATRVLLIEDERPAMEHLERLIGRVFESRPHRSVDVIGRIGSCEEAIEFLQRHSEIDLILCDIQLGDGHALSIFDVVTAPAPVIFCTAYDQFVLDALSKGGVDYLLKPIREEQLDRALAKLEAIEERARAKIAPTSTDQAVSALAAASALLAAQHPVGPTPRYVVKRGADFVAVDLHDVAYFVSEHKLTLLVQNSGETAYLDTSLSALEEDLCQSTRGRGAEGPFFRANRSLLVSQRAVESFRSGLKGRVQLRLRPASDKDTTVSAANAAAFKQWFSSS